MTKPNFSPHTTAILKALLVTFLWSTSFVFIKIGLEDIPPLTFAGLRYSIAAGCLLAYAYQRGSLGAMRQIARRDIGWLMGFGVIYIAVAQGAQFIALDYLPSVTLSLLMNFTAIIVSVLALWLLKEFPRPIQWLGTAIFLGGVLLYFHPIDLPQNEIIGLGVGVVCVLSNSFAAILGRHINRQGHLPPLTVTLVSMGTGATILLVAGISIQGLPALDFKGWAIIIWLAVLNTAFTFMLWNQTLRVLSAMESTIINNTMTAQIAILAWVFLGEAISLKGIFALMIAVVGIFMAQLRQSPKKLVDMPATANEDENIVPVSGELAIAEAAMPIEAD